MSLSFPSSGVFSSELHHARSIGKSLFYSAILFGVFTNLLLLTGPLFMMLVFDRVLTSHSVETLVSLLLLVAGLYLIMAFLDFSRRRAFSILGETVHERLAKRVFQASLSSARDGNSKSPNSLNDLSFIKNYYASPAYMAWIDIPWTPIYLVIIFAFHPYLGWLSVIGGLALITLAALNQFFTNHDTAIANRIAHDAALFSDHAHSQKELVASQGMDSGIVDRWIEKYQQAKFHASTVANLNLKFTSASKSFRLFLQSAILALGAFLYLNGEVSSGAMVAASIMLSRALAPIEQLIGQYPTVRRYRASLQSVDSILSDTPIKATKLPPSAPLPKLNIEGLTFIPSGAKKPVLTNISFQLNPGQILGIIGQSGSGKTTLARVILGLLPATSGLVRLDEANLCQYDTDNLRKYIGYVPQDPSLFAGTISDNISRMTANPDRDAVIVAAQKANVHELITRLPNGYETEIGVGKAQLSGGEQQRIALARALYGDPVLLILDEPTSTLDVAGTNALKSCMLTFKNAGNSVIVMSHRPAVISECDLLLVMHSGAVSAFGQTKDVMKSKVRNSANISLVGTGAI